MEPTLNLLSLAPLMFMGALVLVVLGALVVGVRTRSAVGSEAAGTPGWQLVLFGAVVAILLIQVVGYTLAFVI